MNRESATTGLRYVTGGLTATPIGGDLRPSGGPRTRTACIGVPRTRWVDVAGPSPEIMVSVGRLAGCYDDTTE